MSFPKLPPYTVPDADRDLLDCGVVLTDEHRVNVWALNAQLRLPGWRMRGARSPEETRKRLWTDRLGRRRSSP